MTRTMINLYTTPVNMDSIDSLFQSIKATDSPVATIRWRISSNDVMCGSTLAWTNGILDYSETQTITFLNIGSHDIKDRGVQFLVDALRNNTNITSIYLDRNHINSSGAQYLADLLKTNKALRHLDLGANEIGDEVRSVLNVETTIIHDELRTVFGDEAPSYRTIARWAQWFREGREEIEDEE
ncbi:unnamed protein product [Rotaria sordida]|uniref:Uncharacterized protein n=1 Tax=Rotaria sordida TaxID=392033 RepID=A0A819MZZ9_9BILA|nr:unnamed protein product [Rotaria sordida]